MDSSCKRSNGRLSFEANRPRFFEIIIQDTILDGKLGIPNKFVRDYGKYLSNKVLLKVPTGAVWEVELLKSEGKIWLQIGWRKFMECYSLIPGSLLVFECESIGRFNVVIFDKTALEIDYPSSTTNVDMGPVLEEQLLEPAAKGADDDVSIEIIDDSPWCSETKEKPLAVPCPQPQESMKANLSAALKQDNSITKSNADNPLRQSEALRGSRDITSQKGRLSRINWSKEKLTEIEKENALRRANAAFRSNNPFFMVVMQPSYVFGRRLAIPTNFVRQYVKNEHGNGILCVSERTWSVMYWKNSSNGKAQITGGWDKFVWDNYLEVGDVCVFELTNSIEVSLKVFISRAAEDENYRVFVGDQRAEDHVQS